MAFEHVCAVAYAVAHDVDIRLVEGRRPDVVLVREACEEVARAGAAVPDVVVVLPVLAEGGREVFGCLCMGFQPENEKVVLIEDKDGYSVSGYVE